MSKEIEIILNFRKYLLTQINGLSVEDLNYVPENHNNNIIWNLGHLNAVVQALCYRSSQLPLRIDDPYFASFLPGTSPNHYIVLTEIDIIKQQLITSIAGLNKDLEKGLFTTYHPVEKVKTVYDIDITTIDDALKYIIHHEGVHYNAIMQLKRIISKHAH